VGRVIMRDFEFTPTNLGVEGSGPGLGFLNVTFSNLGPSTHWVAEDVGVFDSGALAPGAAYTATVRSDRPEMTYHCKLHPTMRGKLTLKKAQEGPDKSGGGYGY